MEDHQHDCTEVISKVYLALDGEMTADEEKHFLKEINSCSCCLDKFKIERSFKQFLVNKIRQRPISQDCISSIREKIQELSSNRA